VILPLLGSGNRCSDAALGEGRVLQLPQALVTHFGV
jgi:hypothetical protein